MEYETEPEYVSGVYALAEHFAFAAGVKASYLAQGISQGSLPKLPPHQEFRVGGKRAWTRDDVESWAAKLPRYRSELVVKTAEMRLAKARAEQARVEAENALFMAHAKANQMLIKELNEGHAAGSLNDDKSFQAGIETANRMYGVKK